MLHTYTDTYLIYFLLSFSFLILKHSNTCFAINFWGSSFSLGGFIKNKNFVHSYKMFIFQVIQLKHFFFPGKRGIQLKSDIHPPSRVYNWTVLFFLQIFYKVLNICQFLLRVCGCLIAILLMLFYGRVSLIWRT